ncbi:hypothetical protein E8E14_000653 [Neopestalotiopsis sp. 37M]|nr:hypothetical protein E8E14_000653 [Neopestalotiopsis sp. 37M]
MTDGQKAITVVIVGAGFAGLVAAIECRLRGMRAILVEKYPTSRTQGDVIDFFPNGGLRRTFGEVCVDYVEPENGLPYVITEKGTKYEGDVVVAADDPRSLARTKIPGLPESSLNSGYAIYRAYFTMGEEHKKNPLVAEYTNPDKDYTRMWIGKDLHFIVTTTISKSLGNFIKSLKEIVKMTPADQLIDYKLVWRDPIKTWLGKSGRTVVIGDAAHCHLPTSGQGGSQAVEYGAVLAECLSRCRDDMPLALKAFEKVRFNRSHATHILSTQTRDEYHNIEWTPEFCKENPDALFLPRPVWIAEQILGYQYPNEILGFSYRARGIAVSQAIGYAFSFLYTYIFLIAVEKISWRYFIINGCWDILIVIAIFFTFPETRGKTLEEVDQIFDGLVHTHSNVNASRLGVLKGLSLTKTVSRPDEIRLEETHQTVQDDTKKG